MMNVMSTMERSRDALFTQGAELARRGALLGLEILERVETRTGAARQTLNTRREALNGAPVERLERRILTRLERFLEVLNQGAATQRKRLTADAGEEITDAILVEDTKASSRPGARANGASKSRVARSTKKAVVKKAAPKTPVAKAKTRETKSAKATKKSARASTRWLNPPSEDVSALAELSAKELIKRAPRLSDSERKSLLSHERATKKRKTVLAALQA